MRLLKRTIQWTIGIICGLYLSLQIIMNIPVVQQWAGSAAASILKKTWDWNVSIGRVRLGLWNRVIIDDIRIRDKQDSVMVHAARLAAKIEIMPLYEGRISIANAQLFGTRFHLYQMTPQDRPNFQFLIDTFSSDEESGKPINLHIGSVLLRRVAVRWDQHWKAPKSDNTLDLAHLDLQDIALTAHLRLLTRDSLNVELKRLSFREKSGFSLKQLSFEAEIGKEGGRISDFKLLFPNTELTIPSVQSAWAPQSEYNNIIDWVSDMSWNTEAKLVVTPSDFKAFVPVLKNAHSPIQINVRALGSEGCLNIPQFRIANGGTLSCDANAFVYEYLRNPELILEIRRLQANSKLQQFVSREFLGNERELSPILTRLDTITMSGRVQLSDKKQSSNLHIKSRVGDVHVEANAKSWNSFNANVFSSGIKLNKLLSSNGTHALEKVSFDVKAHGLKRDENGMPKLSAHVTFPEFVIQGREYANWTLSSNLNKGRLSVKTDLDDQQGEVHAMLSWKPGVRHYVNGELHVESFLAEGMGLGDRYPDTRFSIDVDVDASASNIDDLIGKININDFLIESSDSSTIIVGPKSLSLSTMLDKNRQRTLYVESEVVDLFAQGRFRFSTLAGTLQNVLHEQLPNLVPRKPLGSHNDTVKFALGIQDTSLLRKVLLSEISIPEKAVVNGFVQGSDSLQVKAYIPHIYLGREHLRNSNVVIKGTPKQLSSQITLERLQKNGFVTISLNANANSNRLRLVSGVDNKRKPHICGELDVTASFMRSSSGGTDVKAWIAPTKLVISDTTWHIHPANIEWSKQTATIKGFRVSQSPSRGIDINGRISAKEEDTLRVNLNRINAEYILDLVNFKAVEFSGHATGSAVASGILSKPMASADIEVEDFCFNRAQLGTLQASANWGKTEFFLGIDATISDPQNNHHSTITGGFDLGNKTKPNGLDLRVHTKGFNLAFMNFFTKDIFEDFQGRATGYCRIFGPFKAVDLEGDFMLDHVDCKLPMLGTSYKIYQDSVHIKPGEISVQALLRDKFATHPAQPYVASANKNNIPHTALLKGTFRHDHFKDLTFELNVDANNFLGYDFKDFGENSFYATCFASGDISLRGIPGRLVVDIDAMPEKGTVFTYNVSTPEALTEAGFITFKSPDSSVGQDSVVVAENMKTLSNTQGIGLKEDAEDEDTSSDLFLNFNLQTTPDTKMRLLMDRKSGDMIEISGSGRIMAKFHNKGRFNIYGTYRIQDGYYRFSVQDIIRREFKFQPNGTITFGGDAMKADLNLKAVYCVHGVSLDDIATNALGFAKTRVDCIMNLTGHPEQPSVSFDFDLPDATEDERQMVRSLVSTEEERNMQAIYLLGLGRFYSFDSQRREQSTAAINSLVSSTLSSQLNQFISQAVDASNWSFGTNFKTSDDGWRNLDVEGMLNGSLFDNRLLLSGNFGYREKYYTQRNFISDVSVEYLLTKNGSISLKAYNQANDRYFVQSSLNTQGIGIQFKKDFNRFSDLFFWLMPRKSKEEE